LVRKEKLKFNLYNMPKPIVYITRKLPKDGLEDLYKHCQVKMHSSQNPPSRKQLLSYAKKADALISVLTEKIDKEVFDVGPNIKIVANYAIGFDNIDLKAAKLAGVPASNTPSNLAANAVAQHAMAVILTIARKLPEADKFVKAGKYQSWDPALLLGDDMNNKTLGIVGSGRIGSSLASIAFKGYDMDILYFDVIRNKDLEKKYKAKKVNLNQLLKNSDYVSLHVPLLPSTKHLIGSKELSQMKDSAILINTSRGPVVDEKALVKALKSNKILGAGIDVFEFEPKLAPGLSRLSNAILTPHIASATHASRREMGEMATQNVLDVLIRGKRPSYEVKI
jgi:glyoxylate reductase